MLRILTAVVLMIAASAAADAACKDEVAAALEKQRKTSGFHMDTTMLSPDGRLHMTVDYLLPDRMRQIVGLVDDPKPVETVLIGTQAWSKQDGPWTPLQAQLASQLAEQMQETVGDNDAKLGDFECLGKMSVDGKDYLAYQGENLSPDAKTPPPKTPDRAIRIIYVEPTTGLPMRSIYARANKLDKPIFEATYSYPADIKIDAPAPPATPPPALSPSGK